MKKRLFICLWIVTAGVGHAQENRQIYLCDKKINWGIKIGLSTDLPAIKLRGTEALWTETSNKTNFQMDVLMRLNLSHFFFQPEAGYSNTNEIFHIVANGNSENPTKATMETTVRSSNFSALLGYYSVKQNEYALCVFSGAKLKYAHYLYTDYPGQEDISEHNILYNVYIVTGLGVNISNLFFDFRYDIALWNKNIAPPQSLLTAYDDLSIIKRANILGFSIGVMF